MLGAVVERHLPMAAAQSPDHTLQPRRASPALSRPWVLSRERVKLGAAEDRGLSKAIAQSSHPTAKTHRAAEIDEAPTSGLPKEASRRRGVLHRNS